MPPQIFLKINTIAADFRKKTTEQLLILGKKRLDAGKMHRRKPERDEILLNKNGVVRCAWGYAHLIVLQELESGKKSAAQPLESGKQAA